jgi:hypothetical protein
MNVREVTYKDADGENCLRIVSNGGFESTTRVNYVVTTMVEPHSDRRFHLYCYM